MNSKGIESKQNYVSDNEEYSDSSECNNLGYRYCDIDLTDDEIEHSKRALDETTPHKDKLHSNRVSKVLESYLF